MQITLTDADLMDIGMGHTINALAEDGSEIELSGDDLSINDLRTIERGGTVTLDVEGIEVELTS